MPISHDVLPTPIKRILLIKLRHHGDMLLTTPVINTLHRQYPDAGIDILLYKETEAIVRYHPALAQIHVIDRSWKKQGIGHQLQQETALIKTLRSRHYDIVINLADQWRSAIITYLSGATLRIGFDYPKRRSFFWHKAHNRLVSTENHGRLHTVEQNLSILAPLDIAHVDSRTSMYYPAADDTHRQTVLASRGITGDYLVIQPTSRWNYKCWDDEKMAELIDALQEQNLPIVLTAAPDKHERDMIGKILALCHNPRVVSLAGELTLTQLAAVIDHARLFIGVDSAPMHMAAALNTPCVALFGPTKLTFWRPWSENSTVIWAGNFAELPPPDDIDTSTPQRYLSAIPVDAVLQAARGYLA
ncbi:putative lipopolysaccharide heptosyltransferase III [Acerihabitans sp. TG2]|uniref:putative lipopolysaccharide heptosyltransferase III n=1 Tax=Acerihabitans sp. TG2 TaxID=3096008 RepID=UPI002B23E78A|nr:putative lipopolysaccharide heptosyltransferase III [Acerihabitans sp. TG2]MEA9392338.1 putative lipopolysaccharide heptosyltransferase III [Acerihabitans sp. TG2]